MKLWPGLQRGQLKRRPLIVVARATSLPLSRYIYKYLLLFYGKISCHMSLQIRQLCIFPKDEKYVMNIIELWSNSERAVRTGLYISHSFKPMREQCSNYLLVVLYWFIFNFLWLCRWSSLFCTCMFDNWWVKQYE